MSAYPESHIVYNAYAHQQAIDDEGYEEEAYDYALAAMESTIKSALADEGSDVSAILLDHDCGDEAVDEFYAIVRSAAWWKTTNEQLGLATRVYVQNMVERAAVEAVRTRR